MQYNYTRVLQLTGAIPADACLAIRRRADPAVRRGGSAGRSRHPGVLSGVRRISSSTAPSANRARNPTGSHRHGPHQQCRKRGVLNSAFGDGGHGISQGLVTTMSSPRPAPSVAFPVGVGVVPVDPGPHRRLGVGGRPIDPVGAHVPDDAPGGGPVAPAGGDAASRCERFAGHGAVLCGRRRLGGA